MYLPRAIGLEGGSSEPDTCENLRREELYQSMNRSDRCSIGMKEGQSEPAGTCEKQGYRSFSLSIRCEGEVSESVPDFMPILHWSEYLQWLQFLASKDTPNSLPSS